MKSIYQDIAERTDGNIYVGVVGPVRTGKSTFVRQFMQKLILPNISDKNDKKRATDELPQSADGKTIMTTQPKFVPSNAVAITLTDKSAAKVRLVDCVGYPVAGAEGLMEDDKPRLVNTPWSDEPIPFDRAAEIGTHAVATEHSTVAVVVTTDGSIGEIPRENFVSAEERTIRELTESGKPFVVVVNSTRPDSEQAKIVTAGITDKYGVTALTIDAATADKKTMEEVLTAIVKEFPVTHVSLDLPKWVRALSNDNALVEELTSAVRNAANKLDTMNKIDRFVDELSSLSFADKVTVGSLNLATGEVRVNLAPVPELFFDIIGKEAGVDVKDEYSLMSFVTSAAYAQKMFDRLKGAFDEADANGYGIVYPDKERLTLEEPQLIKQGNVYGVLIRASAPSYHIVRVDVKTEVSPMVGTEQQSKYLLEQYKNDPATIWNANMFGRSMAGVTEEGLSGKCTNMPQEIKQKLTKTLGRIVNENRGGLICFLL